MFDPDVFVNELAKQIADQLRRRAGEFKAHRLGAVALETHPWHKGTALSVLIETDERRKWDMGDWEHQEFAILDGPLLTQGYKKLRDPDAEGSACYAPFFRRCAQALCHKAVKAALKHYTLEADFELFLADPDDPNDSNYCEEILGVDKRKRKVKTEIVDDLDEALKDPESVLVLKYMYREQLSKRESDQIALLHNLEILYLPSMGLQRVPQCVVALPNLKELDLDYNRITSLAGLASLSNLQLLSLRGNGSLTHEMCQEISALGSLRELRVGECGMTDIPVSWQRLHLLETIFLFGNPIAAVPEWLPALPHLKRLGLVEVLDDRKKDQLRERHPHLEIW